MSSMNATRNRPFPPAGHEGPRDILVIGGGASGVLMAAQLLGRDPDTRVTIVEGRNLLGCGLAYSTRDMDHLLNTRTHNMSAFPEDPHHLLHWLQTRPGGETATPDGFISRATYGDYLAGLLSPWMGAEAGADRLACLRQACVKVEETATGIRAELADGSTVEAETAVLATGHVLVPRDPAGLISGAWDDAGGTDPEGRVVIVGTGLSMVDQVLSLLNRGHRGEIVAVSRRGLLPRAHAAVKPLKIGVEDLPDGASVSAMLHWLRGLARRAEAEGGSWRDAMDGIRPHVTRLWQRMAAPQRARFLRHAVSWWEVHRHRIPPASSARLDAAIASGQLKLVKANFQGAEQSEAGQLLALLRPRGAAEVQKLEAARIFDCRGIRNDPVQNASPLMADLLARGKARPDPLRIGLDVTDDCRLVAADGTASQRLIAVGPVSRAAFWEITAIPDIREQAAQVARRILANTPA